MKLRWIMETLKSETKDSLDISQKKTIRRTDMFSSIVPHMVTEDRELEQRKLFREKLTQERRQRVLLGPAAKHGLSRVLAPADVHQFVERLPNFCWG